MKGNKMNFARAHGDYLEPHEESQAQQLHEFSEAVLAALNKGWVRAGHGMNGKNADLDPGGQLTIEHIEVLDLVKRDNLVVRATIKQYANICAPTDDNDKREKALQQNAEFIVCECTAYSGEWTGEDYWCFHRNGTVEIECTVDEMEENKAADIAERLAKAIMANPEVKAFEERMIELYREVDALHKLTNKQLGITRTKGTP